VVAGVTASAYASVTPSSLKIDASRQYNGLNFIERPGAFS
jgi:hypothetical protein